MTNNPDWPQVRKINKSPHQLWLEIELKYDGPIPSDVIRSFREYEQRYRQEGRQAQGEGVS